MKKKTLRKIISLFAVTSAVFAFTGCDLQTVQDEESADKVISADRAIDAEAKTSAGVFEIKKTEYNFDRLGQYEEIEALSDGHKAAGAELISDNEEVVAVSGNTIIAVGNGTASVTVSYGGEETVLVVTVASEGKVNIEGERMIALSTEGNTSAELTASVTVPTVFDRDDCGVTWVSDNPEVASVNENGVVTAVSAGVAQITARSRYQISEVNVQNVMGQTIENTETRISDDVITVMVDNEFDSDKNAEIIGTYEGHYDWKGFALQATEDNPCYKEENLKWIRSKVVLELHEDGTFTQKVLNAQRKTYMDSIDSSLPESTFEEQTAKYGKNNLYVYNSYKQSGTDDEFADEKDKEFADITGMEEKGAGNFTENGYYMVLNGNLILFFGQVNGFTGEYESSQFVYGPVENGEYLNNAYVPFTNLVPVSDNMTMVLEKAE